MRADDECSCAGELLHHDGFDIQACQGAVVWPIPMRELCLPKKVAGVRKRWLSHAVVIDRIPADVVNMQMCAEHNIDVIGLESGFFKVS